MQNNDILYKKLEKAICENCFITHEIQAISENSTIKMRWLFDLRAVILRSDILNAYSEFFWNRYKDEDLFQICGLELAAVPLVAAVIMKFHEKGRTLNGFIIRKSRKKSGLLKMTEGEIVDLPIIILDDLLNTGSSIIRQIEIIEELHKEVKEVFTILRFRDIDYYKSFKDKGIPHFSIFELNDFKDSLNVVNLLPHKIEKQVESPFEKSPIWYSKGETPNYFYVNPKSGPVVSKQVVFFGTDEGILQAKNIFTGKELWKYKIPFGSVGKFIFSTPVIYKDLIIFGAYDGNVYALDKNTGKRVWMFMEAEWIGSSPCVSEDLGILFIGLEFGLFSKKGGVVGLDVITGKKLWEYRTSELTHASPAYSNKFKLVACGSNDGVLSVLCAKTGVLKWTFKTKGEIKYAPSFSDSHGFIIVLGFDEFVYVLKTKTGEVVTRYEMGFGGYSTPLVVDDMVICTSFDKCVHCFNIYTGVLIWKYNTGARCFSTPLLVEEKVYVGSNNGQLFEIDSKNGNVSGIFHTRERIVNKIAYDEETKIFFIPTFANEIFAFKKK